MTAGDPHYILNQDQAQLEASLAALGEPAYRARQVWHWLYHRLAHSFAEMTDLPRGLRDRLSHGHVLAEIGAGTARHVPRARGTICGS